MRYVLNATLSMLAGVAALSLLLTSPVVSQDQDEKPRPDPVRGQELAEKLCVSCHVISESDDTAVPAGVPTFRGIANKPGQTAEHIQSKLIQPHAPMPDIQLSRKEIDDIIAYLDELRSEDAGPPLLAPQNKNTLPDYPEEA